MTHPAKPSDHQHLRSIIRRLNGDDFEWRVDDQPHVDCHNFDSLDDALEELGRRMRKNGRLEEFEQRQHFTSDSKERREEREAQAYRAEEGKSRERWRGGVGA